MSDLEKYAQNTQVDVAQSTPLSQGALAMLNLRQQAQAMQDALSIAQAMCATQMVPKSYFRKPEDGAAAIMYGAELGLNAMQSLQQIMVINGKPGIETRTAVALLKGHGYDIRTVSTSDESVTVEGTGPLGEHEESTWDIARATKAGYTSNKLYQTIPQQMLYAKAAMEVARKIAPHVLSGIAYSTDELRLEEQPLKATAKRMDSRRGAGAVMAALEKKPQASQEDAGDVVDETDWGAAINACKTIDTLQEVMQRAQPTVSAEQWDTLCEQANAKSAELTGGAQ
ncbi:hypothetical protein NY035_01850 [Corynebacterium diphtheriae bv. mitis]|uniref:hypothetical protein n=1 Tax=Corynebacterium diphtheriae TaxID=1717 RepID=UPI00217D74A2|nr:hypothetical protein [Corynebacterium diphtheriae]UWE84715.1 hypothetical protein NY053_05025 [Corynebacterium diphtheriae bv. mitis]UWE87731.1 hypothetical protein NY054_10135 [Corynebacterium diphtheriae bv. mitis]UWE92916.1 hypothetical protein NY044_05020 [Corynebacterium diphtheriae bv. mitis]UWE97097.1 hypothetical protein NY039_03775 [Corynebacterium diphtheriae bv. mitis]UWE98972.1 hypothetical protein NY040_01855 [Corynebacterium diphtheriae bv. mitis]